MDLTTLAATLRATVLDPVEVELPHAGRTTIHVLRRVETRAARDVPRSPGCWAPNKPALLFEGRSTWAELILVDLLEAAGWDARWVRVWSGGRQFCSGVGEQRRLAGRAEAVFDAIHASAPDLRGAGTWDVIAWDGDEVLFLEAKPVERADHLPDAQLAFLDAALALGIGSEAFAIVEYDAGAPIPSEKAARKTRAPAAPRVKPPRRVAALDPELARLIDAAAEAPAPQRIDHRDGVAAYGSAAIAPMERWATDRHSPGFAIAVLEAIGRASDPSGANAALRRLRVGVPGWDAVIDPAIARVEAARRAARREAST